ncbi:hypothetical protein MAR_018918 [Mya arenaria]|uniref:Uncharacterized protein n=1 Tax=Mya arenaria TaxID=6604 RepID=A0ABY7EG17_MYAAR|nr:hypothetical protein MAR_018918 [Mya arenaria]
MYMSRIQTKGDWRTYSWLTIRKNKQTTAKPLAIICSFFIGDEEISMKEFEMTIKLIEHDINGMKRKVWIELPEQLHRLKKVLSNRSFVDNTRNVYNDSAGNCDPSVQCIRNVDNLHDRLTKAFEAEKVRAKITEQNVEQLNITLNDYLENVEKINMNNLKISALEDELSKLERSDTNKGQII